jgi:hypothetical protein
MTNYTCDRCGAECRRGVQMKRTVVIEWSTDEKEVVELSFGVCRVERDHETPDLCVECYAHILDRVAALLDAAALESPAAVPS